MIKPNSFSPLISEIKTERESLKDLVGEIEETLIEIEDDPTRLELRAVGSILHDFYTGTEKIFRLIAIEVDGNLPSGENWHKRLLDRMAVEVENLRPPVIDKDLKERLAEYLRFRHLFRHIYGFELNWKKCRPLAEQLTKIYEDLQVDLDEFQHFLRKIDEG